MFKGWQLLKNIYKHFMIPKHLDSAFRKPVWDLYFKIVWYEPGLGMSTISNYSPASWIQNIWCWGFILTVTGQVFDPCLEAAKCNSLLSLHSVLSAHVGAWLLTAQCVHLREWWHPWRAPAVPRDSCLLKQRAMCIILCHLSILPPLEHHHYFLLLQVSTSVVPLMHLR